jgi:hypothetical protein
LFEAANEAVDVVQSVLLDVEGVAAEACAMREQDPVRAGSAGGAAFGEVD